MSALKTTPVLWIVIPCYNEQEVLPVTAPLFLDELESMIREGLIAQNSRILFVDDGSKDSTWEIISSLSTQDPHYIGIRQSRNRGHQNAVLAGLMQSLDEADAAISIDCDGQDDIHVMSEMVRAYRNGSDIVYGVRSDRETDTFFKRTTAEAYYRLLDRMGVEVVFNHADYRLASSRVLRHLADFGEVNLYLRGIFPLIGYQSSIVAYKRKERISGTSHYPLGKMLSLAFDGITSLSTRPITIITGLGSVASVLGMIGILWAIVTALTGHSVAGWASTVCIVLFMGGLQLVSLGIIGTYVGKTYLETKHRPRYIISETTWEDEGKGGERDRVPALHEDRA